MQEIHDVKVAGQRVCQADKGPGQHGLAAKAAPLLIRTGIPGPDVPPGADLTH